MTYTPQQIAAALDLAVLSPTPRIDDVKNACGLAREHNIASVCVRPCDVSMAQSHFHNVSTVIGFPHGSSTAAVKLYEAQCAILQGACELDVVVNYGRFLQGDWQVIERELKPIVEIASYSCVKVKAILETCAWDDRDILIQAARVAASTGVNWLKTSTGCGSAGATVEGVDALLEAAEPYGGLVQVKASGGIRTYADVKRYLDMGCTRLGSSRYLELLP